MSPSTIHQAKPHPARGERAPFRRPAKLLQRKRPHNAAALSCLLLSGLLFHCSLLNQEGPEVTCADLQCGKINACQDGIIAQCADGVTVKYHACGSVDVCVEPWQSPGQFRCSAELTDCEGCRPDRVGCTAGGTGGMTP